MVNDKNNKRRVEVDNFLVTVKVECPGRLRWCWLVLVGGGGLGICRRSTSDSAWLLGGGEQRRGSEPDQVEARGSSTCLKTNLIRKPKWFRFAHESRFGTEGGIRSGCSVVCGSRFGFRQVQTTRQALGTKDERTWTRENDARTGHKQIGTHTSDQVSGPSVRCSAVYAVVVENASCFVWTAIPSARKPRGRFWMEGNLMKLQDDQQIRQTSDPGFHSSTLGRSRTLLLP